MAQISYAKLPIYMQHTAQLYVERGVPGGGFFTALVSNDLMRAFAKADDVNAAAMRDWVMWLYNEAPRGCYGSPEAVHDWITAGGLAGLAQDREVYI
jgi:hypothetical protein